jgi:hypothetical protein
MSYADIAQHCLAYSRAKGFHPTTMATCAVRLMCISKEISEFRDEIRKGDIQGMSLESADIAIYACVIMADLGTKTWITRGRMHLGPAPICSPSEMVDPLRNYVDQAFEAWRRTNTQDVLLALELLLAQLVDIRTRCLRLPNSLEVDMRYKLAWSARRPALHGGKHPSS